MTKKTHGLTESAKPITEDLIAELVDTADAGYDVGDDAATSRRSTCDGMDQRGKIATR